MVDPRGQHSRWPIDPMVWPSWSTRSLTLMVKKVIDPMMWPSWSTKLLTLMTKKVIDPMVWPSWSTRSLTLVVDVVASTSHKACTSRCPGVTPASSTCSESASLRHCQWWWNKRLSAVSPTIWRVLPGPHGDRLIWPAPLNRLLKRFYTWSASQVHCSTGLYICKKVRK